MLADGAHVDVEQLGHKLLSQPDCLVLVAGLDACTGVLCGEDQELSCGVADKLTRRFWIRYGFHINKYTS